MTKVWFDLCLIGLTFSLRRRLVKERCVRKMPCNQIEVLGRSPRERFRFSNHEQALYVIEWKSYLFCGRIYANKVSSQARLIVSDGCRQSNSQGAEGV